MKRLKIKLKKTNINKLNLSLRDEMTLFILFTALILIAIGRFYIIPIWDEYTGMKDRNKVLEMECNKVNIAIKKIDEKRTVLNETNKKFKEKLDIFPKTPYVAKLLLEVKAIADKNNIDFTNETIGKNNINKNFNNTGLEIGIQPISLTFSGGYKDIMAFMKDVESVIRIGEVASINISKGETDKLRGNVSINFCYFPVGEDKEKYDFNKGSYGKKNPFE